MFPPPRGGLSPPCPLGKNAYEDKSKIQLKVPELKYPTPANKLNKTKVEVFSLKRLKYKIFVSPPQGIGLILLFTMWEGVNSIA